VNELLVVASGVGAAVRKAHANELRRCLWRATQHDNQGGVAYRGSVIATVARDLGASLGTELPVTGQLTIGG
jgi:hypothetical protein